METNEQISLVKKLHDLKSKMLQSNDQETITLYIKEVIKIATPVPPYVKEKFFNEAYKNESKQMILALLKGDIKCIEDKSYPDWETIHFQVASSIAMLVLNFIDGGLTRVNELAST